MVRYSPTYSDLTLKKGANKMKTVLLFSCLSSCIWAEAVTLDPIDIRDSSIEPGTVVLSEDEARRTDSVTLQERLENDTSFAVTTDNKGEAALSFRGLGFRATEYVEDGIPLYRNSNGFIDSKLTMTDTELQIHNGSGTSPLGVSAMGGVVEIVSKHPAKQFESLAESSLSNNDEYFHAYAGSKGDDLYIQADVRYYHRSEYSLSDDYTPTLLQPKGKRINSDKIQKTMTLKSGFFIDDTLHFAGKMSSTRARYGMPPNIYTDLDVPKWDAYSRIDPKNLDSFYLYGDYDNDDLTLSLRAYYDDYEDIFKIYDAPDYLSNWPEVTYHDHRLGTVLKGILHRDRHTSTFVFQAEENKHFRSGGGLAEAKYEADTIKASLLHLWEPSTSWQLEGGLSYTLLQSKKAADASAAEPPENKHTFDAQVKITYAEDENTFYGSIAKKSRMPSMSEMFTFFPWLNANPGLKPEQSMQYDAGYRFLPDEKTSVDLSLYYYDIKDLILYRDQGYINREEAIHYGTQIQVNTSYFDRNEIRFSYAYTHTEDSEGEALAYIPLHQLKIEDTVRIDQSLTAYISYRYTGSRYSPNSATYTDEQLELRAYHLVDTQITYQLSDSADCRIGIKNLLDESYEWRYGYPAEGRSYYVRLEWKLE